MKKIKIFLGAYINSTNAQNLNCLALAKYLDKDKFDVYTLELKSVHKFFVSGGVYRFIPELCG